LYVAFKISITSLPVSPLPPNKRKFFFFILETGSIFSLVLDQNQFSKRRLQIKIWKKGSEKWKLLIIEEVYTYLSPRITIF